MLKKLEEEDVLEEMMECCISMRRKDYVDRIMTEENDWGNKVDGDAVEGPVYSVSQKRWYMH